MGRGGKALDGRQPLLRDLGQIDLCESDTTKGLRSGTTSQMDSAMFGACFSIAINENPRIKAKHPTEAAPMFPT
jgi:hypothetical protein